jgi:hypothetical protein
MNMKRSMLNRAMASLMMSMAMMGDNEATPLIREPSKPRYAPWSDIQLTKSERKGKTPEELQVLRKAKYEAAGGAYA